jgi:PIN domain nuclease of toxin-antitoxin system
MKDVVLDTSAILAVINEEKGADVVTEMLPHSFISSVNLAEIVSVMARRNIDAQKIQDLMNKLVKGVISFNEEQAYIAGYLETISRQNKLSLSLGDRACLALGQYLDIPVYTADRKWQEIPSCRTEIKMIR